MEIRNLMESLAHRTVEEICREQESAGGNRYCTSTECKVDAVCYLLNRIPPRYVSSGRGMAHLAEELDRDQQLQVDVIRLAHEGLQRVSSVARKFYSEPAEEHGDSGACFNFPTLRARILDGESFLPLSDVEATLEMDEAPVAMFDSRWSNPYEVSRQTPGMALFWPAPIHAEAAGERRTFLFTLILKRPGYQETRHSFSLEVESAVSMESAVSLQRDHHLPDLYLFP